MSQTKAQLIDNLVQPITGALGSASAPTFSFTSDPNTGLYSPGADQVAISTGGSGRLFINTLGDHELVGSSNWNFAGAAIRRTSSNTADSKIISFLLDGDTRNNTNLYGNVNFLLRTDSAPTTGSTSVGLNAGLEITSPATVRIGTNGSERLRITSAGLVGVGSSAPQAELNVAKTGGASTVYIESDAGNNATTSILRFGGASGRSASIQGFRGASSNIHSLDFYTYNSGDSFGMRLTPTGLGIGTTSPGNRLHVSSSGDVLRLDSSSTDCGILLFDSVGGSRIGTRSASIIFDTSSSERARIDSSGRLLVGTSTSSGSNHSFQVRNDGGANVELFTSSATADIGPYLNFSRSRGTAAAPTVVAQNDRLSALYFSGYSGAASAYRPAAIIAAFVDGEPDTAGDTTDMPGRLVFSTTADGASSPTERMRIDSNYGIHFGRINSTRSTVGASIEANFGVLGLTSGTNRALDINRQTDDGDLVDFYQANTKEGSISVSGTTVSYNGAHLSRWSQLPSGAEQIEILRGSVLSNIDEMCEWGDEDNEQLNRMKVSDVEGDKNVSGVFQGWDDDDDTYTNDFYCAMTGDFIIRIAEGVTVERGDLLMSAGDGTAKPQDDDIIRSKTIAKVTSTNVSCTYEDGSYCVPCVLMAC